MEMEPPPATGPTGVELGIMVTEENLRKWVHGDNFSVIAESVEKPVCEIDIPLCRMVPMTDVRSPLDPDIQKLRAEFSTGYRRGGASFYVSVHSYQLMTRTVTEEDRQGWSERWRSVEKEFEDRCQSTPALRKFSNKMFFIWDGNHRFKAWMPLIDINHADDPTYHVSVKSTVLKVNDGNNQQLLNAMTHWNK